LTRGGVVHEVRPGGLGEELGLKPGDRVVSIEGVPLRDYPDYKFRITEARVEVVVAARDGQHIIYELEKPEDEDLGVVFTHDVWDRLLLCRNRCRFCFVDQLPPGCRSSLLVKDDDYRLSFLHGNYISLTNLDDREFRRILAQRLSPLYVSVHTTEPALRAEIMGNPGAAGIVEQLRLLVDGGIRLHTQVVLCPGVNDGDELVRTVRELSALGPNLVSVGLVPVGLTRYRGDSSLRTFSPHEARAVIQQVEGWQRQFRRERGQGLVYAADEFYLLAGVQPPAAPYYDDYPQLENGIGMWRLMWDECRRVLPTLDLPPAGGKSLAILTGQLAAPLMREIGRLIQRTSVGCHVEVLGLKNSHFGPEISVAGLLTGSDLMGAAPALRDIAPAPGEMWITADCLQEGESVFLDDMTVAQVEAGLGFPIRPVEPSARGVGQALARFLSRGGDVG